MRICLLSKYPPIEGGVSVRNYWMARGLAARGHQVFVVTNASEVEDEFRMQLTEADESLIQPEFEATGGFIRMVRMPATTMKYRYIPWANPFVSRLASLACQAVREHGCEAIYSYYFETLWRGRAARINMDRRALYHQARRQRPRPAHAVGRSSYRL